MGRMSDFTAVGRVRVTRMQQGQTQFWQREEWSGQAQLLLEAVGAKVGPRTWGAKRVQVVDCGKAHREPHAQPRHGLPGHRNLATG